ncbi:MAG: TetR/AcrR family transcriptional regulator [Chloroflexi bacterium]|nr:TetR/AcrR family transcriptional regulator [Chloroflexota bacterium]
MDHRATVARGEHTRQAILAAAKDLFIRQGYAATTMRQVARAAGITVAAIYNHFPGKDALFDAVLRQAAPLDEIAQLLTPPEGRTAEAALADLFRGALDLLAVHGDYIALALIDAQERGGATLAALIPRVFPGFMALHDALARADAASLRDVPPFIFSRALICILIGYAFTERILRLRPVLNLPETDWATALADVFMHGVLKGQDSGIADNEVRP